MINLNEFTGLKDFHVHTCFCDGENTPEEMIFAALDVGMSTIGFVAHSHTNFDECACASIEATDQYEEEVRTLAMEFGEQIDILCGIEQDYYSTEPTERWDYVIGSVHYLPERHHASEPDGEDHLSFDDTEEMLQQAIDEQYSGDVYSLCEDYYRLVADVVRQTGADIIGHFDLVAKFNKGGEGQKAGKYFDEGHPRYVAAWQKAADALLETGRPFEINYGAVISGRRTEPFPGPAIRKYLADRGAEFIFSSDAHSVDALWAGVKLNSEE